MHETNDTKDTKEDQENAAANVGKSAIFDEPTFKFARAIAITFRNKEPEFERLSKYRERGYNENKEIADAFFDARRRKSNRTNAKTLDAFFNMTSRVAREMNSVTNFLDLQTDITENLKVLDICMAPGGFTSVVLKLQPAAQCYGITLPRDLGGYRVKIPKSILKDLLELDISLLSDEYSNRSIPDNHPSKLEFSKIRPFCDHKFDLIFCDGLKLREHKRPEWRERYEDTRLNISQLILSMQRIRKGGTIVILLHKVEHWDSILTIRAFGKFAKVQLFKPTKYHSIRSCFYMVAKDIDINCEAAREALNEWRNNWWDVTFEGPDKVGKRQIPEKEFVLKVLEEYSDQHIEMARSIWKIQADALSKSEFARDR